MAIDSVAAITAFQFSGQTNPLVEKSYEIGNVNKVTKELIFQKKLKREEERIQPAARTVHPIARMYSENKYYKPKEQREQRKAYTKQTESEENQGIRINIVAG